MIFRRLYETIYSAQYSAFRRDEADTISKNSRESLLAASGFLCLHLGGVGL